MPPFQTKIGLWRYETLKVGNEMCTLMQFCKNLVDLSAFNVCVLRIAFSNKYTKF